MKLFKCFLMMLAVILSGCAGMKPTPESEKTIESIVEVPNFTKEQIYNGSKVWIAENFKSAKAVIEYDNKEEGAIIGNGVISYPCVGIECVSSEAANTTVRFTMRINAKDGKFRSIFNNLVVYRPAYFNPSTNSVNPARETAYIPIQNMPLIKAKFVALSESLKASLDKSSVKSNW